MKGHFIIPIVFLAFILACEKSTPEVSNDVKWNSNKEEDSSDTELISEGKGKARSGSLRFKADLISAVDFIKLRGEVPAQEDLAQLAKEHVVILEVEDAKATTGIYSSKRLLLSKEDLSSYMMAGITNDLIVIQGDETYLAHSTLFDKDIGTTAGGNTLRVFLFFNDLDDSKPFDIQFNDRLFGTGSIKL